MTSDEQLAAWVAGTPKHNGATRSEGECCPDFSCCHPELLAPEDERRRFASAAEPVRYSMLMTFLARAIAVMAPDAKVHIAGDPANHQREQ